MNYLFLLLLALAPGLGLLLYVKKRDKYQPEPWRLIWITFFFSALLVIIAAFVEILFGTPARIHAEKSSFLTLFIDCFLVISLTEELCKYLAIRLYVYNKPEFNEIMDGIVYGAAAGSGFACIENIFYVMTYGFQVGLIRAVMAVPLHILTGALIGYGLAKKKLLKSKYHALVLFIVAVLSHGLYDFALFQKSQNKTLDAFIAILVVTFLIVTIRKMMMQALEISRHQFAPLSSQSLVHKRSIFLSFSYIVAGILLILFGLLMILGGILTSLREGIPPSEVLAVYVIFTIVPIASGGLLFKRGITQEH